MDHLPDFGKPSYYEFRVSGRLSQQAAGWFEGMEVAVNETAESIQTIIKGYMEDQAALHGLISRIRDLGLTLISVNQVEQKEESGRDQDVLDE